MVLVLFALHGAIYLVMKTEGSLQTTVKSWVPKLILLFIALYAAFNLSTLIACPHLIKVIFSRPIIFVVLAVDLLLLFNVLRLVKLRPTFAIGNGELSQYTQPQNGFSKTSRTKGMPRLFKNHFETKSLQNLSHSNCESRSGKDFAAFLCSCLVMALLMITFGLSYYPNMVFSSPHPENSLTINNCCSTNYTLGLLSIIVCIGLPIFLTYTTSVYWIFRGKTQLTETSY